MMRYVTVFTERRQSVICQSLVCPAIGAGHNQVVFVAEGYMVNVKQKRLSGRCSSMAGIPSCERQRERGTMIVVCKICELKPLVSYQRVRYAKVQSSVTLTAAKSHACYPSVPAVSPPSLLALAAAASTHACRNVRSLW